ncbi:hypothetical protein SLE2022_276040 [Rubroshorea leprosula]
MEAEDVIKVPSPSDLDSGSESGEICDSDNSGPHEADCQPGNCEKNDDTVEGEKIELDEVDLGSAQSQVAAKQGEDDSSAKQLNTAMSEAVTFREKPDGFSTEVLSKTVTVEEKLDSSISRMEADDHLNVQNGSPIQNAIVDGTSISSSSIKKVGMANDDQQPSVHVIYSSLTRASKQKLEEVLQEWSKWQAEHGSSSQDENEIIESGEKTYFPALWVGIEKTSAVSFWIDSQTSNEHDKGFIPLDSDTVPLYDRGYAFGLTSADGSSKLEGGLEIIRDASRCFNCGSYSHSLKQCPKPRDNAAVIEARKQHNLKRNQSAGSHNSIRYYQSSQGGKFDDLKPASLTAETRQLLGLGEFDPPPWLNRMREIGYPPGYLDLDDEDQPSGIIIYTDGVFVEGQEDGEISEMKDETIDSERPNKRRKMTIEFPGINAPIPEGADAKRWAHAPAPAPSSSGPSRNRSPQRSSLHSEHGSRGYHHEQRYRNFRDDGPPGVDPGFSLSRSYPPRYDSYMDQSPILTRLESDRDRRSPLSCDDFTRYDYSGSSRYSSSDRRTYPRDHSWSSEDRHRYHSRR